METGSPVVKSPFSSHLQDCFSVTCGQGREGSLDLLDSFICMKVVIYLFHFHCAPGHVQGSGDREDERQTPSLLQWSLHSNGRTKIMSKI